MASLAEKHRKSFEDRLSRIQHGGPNCIGEVHVGPREEVRARDADKARKSVAKAAARARRRGSPLVTLLLLPIAAALGAVSVFAGRVASFQFFQDGGDYAFALAGVPSAMFADLMIAGVLAFLLAWSFRLTWGLRRLAVLGGFVAMMTGEFFVVERFPDVFAAFFSETYVAGILSAPPTFL